MTDRQALTNLVQAWEALPTGHYSARTIERWLADQMKPAIDAARNALGEGLRGGQEGKDV